jgi:hypothetical protein
VSESSDAVAGREHDLLADARLVYLQLGLLRRFASDEPAALETSRASEERMKVVQATVRIPQQVWVADDFDVTPESIAAVLSEWDRVVWKDAIGYGHFDVVIDDAHVATKEEALDAGFEEDEL